MGPGAPGSPFFWANLALALGPSRTQVSVQTKDANLGHQAPKLIIDTMSLERAGHSPETPRADNFPAVTHPTDPGLEKRETWATRVCKDFGVECCTPFKVNRELGFKTGWKA